MSKGLELTVTPLQAIFLQSDADITLFGGAAGGGKSYGLLVKYLLYCLQHAGAKCLILRRTFPELRRSLILVSHELIPPTIARYVKSENSWLFRNGSRLEFGYCERDTDVYQYQSAEYDRIGIDESTHFTEYAARYLYSRCRGANPHPKGMDLATNPGNVGHVWHKSLFIDGKQPFQTWESEDGLKYLFIPAKVQDNPYLMAKDPGYIKRLQALPLEERKALLDGDWDTFAGQYFSCWQRDTHVIQPFRIPSHWRRFMCMDYGLDTCAVFEMAVDGQKKLYVCTEFYRPDLPIPEAARQIKAWMTPGFAPSYIVASPDLWNRRQDTGLSGVEIFNNHGLRGLTKADNRRVPGWQALHSYLLPQPDEQGEKTPWLYIFEGCVNLIRTLPALVRSTRNPDDVADTCEDHAPEALRYGVMSRPPRAVTEEEQRIRRRKRRQATAPKISSITGY